jgi:endonuclease/exonuclease/phosphatase (EEP) superfamily protein YafD
MPPLVQIDQVMLGPGLTATATTTVPIAGTDHRALVATLATAAPE